MQHYNRHSSVFAGILGILALLLAAGLALARTSDLSQVREQLGRYREKISPVLLDEVARTKAYPAYDRQMNVIVTVNRDYFQQDLESRQRLGLSQRNMLKSVRGYAGRLSGRQIEALLASGQVEYVTLDPVLQLSGKPSRTTINTADPTTSSAPVDAAPIADNHVRVTIGVDQIQVSGKMPTGRNVCIAVFDSGMTHPDLTWDSNGIWNGIDFTSGSSALTGPNQDDFGHGTAVSGVIGGDGTASQGKILGIAPDVYFLDLKVVGPDGTGLTSQLIRAIDWVIEHREAFNIRVANLSLGHPAIESYQTDPLCQAVERMVEAGVVTVVSAGNLGKTADYPEIWGGITSPGNDPLAITVGAMNTRGTVTHTDDTATSYSSRGPTYADGLFKPDLVAPGNAILCPSAPGSFLAMTHPELRAGGDYIRLSGSSMATAVVSGTVALMLEANPNLNPNLVKLILLSTATKMSEPSMLEQGNGMVNAKTAVELAKAVNMRTRTVAGGVSPHWTLNGEYGPEEVWAGGAFAYGDQIIYGALVPANGTGLWGDGIRWDDCLVEPDGVFWADSLLQRNGVFWTDGIFWTDVLAWTQGVFWSEGVFWADGIFWTDGVFWTDARGVFWTDSIPVGDPQETNVAVGGGD